MRKIDLEKNRLDLSYQRNLQLLNAILLIGAGSFVAYLASLVLNISKAFQYSIILTILTIITTIFYRKINKNLKTISEEIGKLVQ